MPALARASGESRLPSKATYQGTLGAGSQVPLNQRIKREPPSPAFSTANIRAVMFIFGGVLDVFFPLLFNDFFCL